MWGVEIKQGVRTHLQTLLLEKGSDWVPQLGGTSSPFAVNYSCKNPACTCIPIRADKWMRFATMHMQSMTPTQFTQLIGTLSCGRDQYLTEGSFKTAGVLVNPEWRCPLCITKFSKESWGLQAMICDTRDYEESREEIFIAPLGCISQPVQRAIGYLKVVTLMNEIGNHEFRVREVIEAIGKINEGMHKGLFHPSQ